MIISPKYKVFQENRRMNLAESSIRFFPFLWRQFGVRIKKEISDALPDIGWLPVENSPIGFDAISLADVVKYIENHLPVGSPFRIESLERSGKHEKTPERIVVELFLAGVNSRHYRS
ncbi:MAG: hypothetical protein ACR2F0_09625 [Chthoniobacterales bacterium]